MPPPRSLFVGLGSSAVCYYRVMLPAMALHSDWVGLHGKAPDLKVDTGLIQGDTAMPRFLNGDYDIVVLQQVVGEGWRELIGRMQEQGVKVVFEIDDYLQAIRHMGDKHSGSKKYTAEYVREIEMSMEICDAVIVSTKWLKTKFKKFNDNIYVCRNGVDLARYELEMPQRPSINIGWAGAQGHYDAMVPWLKQVSDIMAGNDLVNFVSLGMNFADGFKQWFPDRAIAVPWSAIEQYPAAMTLFDIAIAPAGKTRFHRGKSDLRWVEAAALGIPIVADPVIYHEVHEGVTGLLASSPEEVKEKLELLVGDEELRQSIGRQARAYVREHRAHTVTSLDWERTFAKILAT